MSWSIFKDVKFFVISCKNKAIIENLKSGGAVQHPLLSESVRFAISDDASPVEVGEAEELYAVPVITAKWVELSANIGQFLPFKPFHPEFKHLFKDFVFAISELSVKDRYSLWALLTVYGAKVQHVLDKNVTHLILGRASGVFYNACKETLNDPGPTLVTPDWILDCLTASSIIPCEPYHPDLLKRPFSPPKIPVMSQSNHNGAFQEQPASNSSSIPPPDQQLFKNDSQPRHSITQQSPYPTSTPATDVTMQHPLMKPGECRSSDALQLPKSCARGAGNRSGGAGGTGRGMGNSKRCVQPDQRFQQQQRFPPSTLIQGRFPPGSPGFQRVPMGHSQRFPIPGVLESTTSSMVGTHHPTTHPGLMLSSSGTPVLPAGAPPLSGSGHHGKSSKSKHSNKHSQEQNLNEEEKDAIVTLYVKNILSSQNKTARDSSSGKPGSSSGSEAGSGGLTPVGSNMGTQGSGVAAGTSGQMSGVALGGNAPMQGSSTPRKPKSPRSPGRAAGGGLGNIRSSPKSPKGNKVNSLGKMLSAPQQPQQSPSLLMGNVPGSCVPSVLLTGGGLPQIPGRQLANAVQSGPPPGTPRPGPIQHFIATNNMPVQQQQQPPPPQQQQQPQHVLSAAPAYIVQRHPNGQLIASVSKPAPQTQMYSQNPGPYDRPGSLVASVASPLPQPATPGVQRQFCQTAQPAQPTVYVRTSQPAYQNDQNEHLPEGMLETGGDFPSVLIATSPNGQPQGPTYTQQAVLEGQTNPTVTPQLLLHSPSNHTQLLQLKPSVTPTTPSTPQQQQQQQTMVDMTNAHGGRPHLATRLPSPQAGQLSTPAGIPMGKPGRLSPNSNIMLLPQSSQAYGSQVRPPHVQTAQYQAAAFTQQQHHHHQQAPGQQIIFQSPTGQHLIAHQPFTATVSRGHAVPSSMAPGSVLLRTVGPTASGIITGTQQSFSHLPPGSLMYSTGQAVQQQSHQAILHPQSYPPLQGKTNHVSMQPTMIRTNTPNAAPNPQMFHPSGPWVTSMSPPNNPSGVRMAVGQPHPGQAATPVRPPPSPVRPVAAGGGSAAATPTANSVALFPPTYYGHEGAPKPSRPEECLVGCVFFLVGYRLAGEQQRASWRRTMRSYGAEVLTTYDATRVTHLVIDCQLEEPDLVKQALRHRIRVVTIFWVNDVLAKGRMIPPYEILHLPSPFSTDITFSFIKSQVISLTGFEGKERLKIEFLIRQLGAAFTDYLEPSNTVLVCKRPEGKKYEMAQLWSIPCVNVRWLQDIYFGDLSPLAFDVPHKYLSFEVADVNSSLDRCTPRVQELMVGWLAPIRLNQEVWIRLTKLSTAFASEERERKRKLESDLVNQPAAKRHKPVLTPLDDSDIELATRCRRRVELLTEEPREREKYQKALNEILRGIVISEDHCPAYSVEIMDLVFNGIHKVQIPAVSQSSSEPMRGSFSTVGKVKLEDPLNSHSAETISVCGTVPVSSDTQTNRDDLQESKSVVERTLENASCLPQTVVESGTMDNELNEVKREAPSESVSAVNLSSMTSGQTDTCQGSPHPVLTSATQSHLSSLEGAIPASHPIVDDSVNRKRAGSPTINENDAKRPAFSSEHLAQSTIADLLDSPMTQLVDHRMFRESHSMEPNGTSCSTSFATDMNKFTPRLCSINLDSEVRICFTAIDYETRLALVELTSRLPDCEIVDSVEEATHLVCGHLLRTPKTYLAIALGRPLVTPKWIQASVIRGTWLEESPWLLEDKEAENQLGVRLAESFIRSRRRRMLGPRASLFAGLEFWLSPGACHREICSSLIKACGGLVRSKRPTQKMALLPQPRQLVICHEDDSHVANYLMRVKAGNKAVHHEEFILSGVLRQELDFESYQIQYVSSLHTSLKAAIAAAAETAVAGIGAASNRVGVQGQFIPSSRGEQKPIPTGMTTLVKPVTHPQNIVVASAPVPIVSSLSSRDIAAKDDIGAQLSEAVNTKSFQLNSQPMEIAHPVVASEADQRSITSTTEVPVIPFSTLRGDQPHLDSTSVARSFPQQILPVSSNLPSSALFSPTSHDRLKISTEQIQRACLLTGAGDAVTRPRPTSLLLSGTHTGVSGSYPQSTRPVTALTAMIVAAESGTDDLTPGLGLASSDVSIGGTRATLVLPKSGYRSQPSSSATSTLNARVAAADAHAVATATALIHNECKSVIASADVPLPSTRSPRSSQPITLFASELENTKRLATSIFTPASSSLANLVSISSLKSSQLVSVSIDPFSSPALSSIGPNVQFHSSAAPTASDPALSLESGMTTSDIRTSVIASSAVCQLLIDPNLSFTSTTSSAVVSLNESSSEAFSTNISCASTEPRESSLKLAAVASSSSIDLPVSCTPASAGTTPIPQVLDSDSTPNVEANSLPATTSSQF